MSFSAQSTLVSAVTPSPNFNERRLPLDMVILHYTGMETADVALDWLCRSESGVSCHYFVFEDGRILQLVDEQARAWHAGKSIWAGETDTNSRSIGIEIVNPGHEFDYPDFADAQIDSVISLCSDICMRHAIIPQHFLAHSDVAPARKRDPGEKFPWDRLADAGVGHWVAAAPEDGRPVLSIGDRGEAVRALTSALAAYGYGIDPGDVYDDATALVVAAFQRHFRPSRVDGRADGPTVETLRRLCDGLDAAV